MNIKTKIKPYVYVFFAYETYDGWNKFGNYDDAQVFNRDADDKPLPLYLCGYLVNEYFGCCERINEKQLSKKPSTSEVKKFMAGCYECIKN